MSELIATTTIKRQPGMLYFVKSDENGNLCVYEATMARGGRQKKKEKKEKK